VSISRYPSVNSHDHTASQKNIPDIIDCNLKKDYQILIVSGTSIPGTPGHRITNGSSSHLTQRLLLRYPGKSDTVYTKSVIRMTQGRTGWRRAECDDVAEYKSSPVWRIHLYRVLRERHKSVDVQPFVVRSRDVDAALIQTTAWRRRIVAACILCQSMNEKKSSFCVAATEAAANGWVKT